MKIFLISIITLLFQHVVFAQQLQQRDANPVDLDSIDMDTYYSKELLIDKMPKFKKEKGDFNKYVSMHVVYPEEAYNRFIEGTVYVAYVIDANGKVKDVVIVQSANALLNTAAMDVIMHSPKWKPASYKGKPVPFKKMSKVTFSR